MTADKLSSAFQQQDAVTFSENSENMQGVENCTQNKQSQNDFAQNVVAFGKMTLDGHSGEFENIGSEFNVMDNFLHNFSSTLSHPIDSLKEILAFLSED